MVAASVLLPKTREILAQHGRKPVEPLFSNAVQAELFEARYKRGPFRVLPRTDGRYVIVDERRPWNDQVVDIVYPLADVERVLEQHASTLERAVEAVDRRADAASIPYDEEAGGPWTPEGAP